MSTLAVKQSPSPAEHVDHCAGELAAARAQLSELSLWGRRELMEDCLDRVVALAPEWVEAACEAKGLPPGSPLRAEEVAAGPMATARHLRLLIDNYKTIEATGSIKLPAPPVERADGSLAVQVVPVKGLFDSVLFAGFKATAHLGPNVKREDLERLGSHWVHPAAAKTVLVLGAGNVSSIPATDAISKIFQEGHVVLLKMNPVNEYLGPIFQRLFARLIDRGFLRIIYGGADVGAAAVEHPDVDEVHITGSIHSHDAIVWGPPGEERLRRKREKDPVLKKPITSELGNVSPWIVVPGEYSESQLRFQAQSVAASIINNASFNCVATKVIITWKDWPQRRHFLDLVEQVLVQVPERKAYYPGALERFARFSGAIAASGCRGQAPLDAGARRRPGKNAATVRRRVVRLRVRGNRLGGRRCTRFSQPCGRFCQRPAVGYAECGAFGAAKFSSRCRQRSLLPGGARESASWVGGHQPLAGARVCHDEPAMGRLSIGHAGRRAKRHRLGAQHVHAHRRPEDNS